MCGGVCLWEGSVGRLKVTWATASLKSGILDRGAKCGVRIVTRREIGCACRQAGANPLVRKWYLVHRLGEGWQTSFYTVSVSHTWVSTGFIIAVDSFRLVYFIIFYHFLLIHFSLLIFEVSLLIYMCPNLTLHSCPHFRFPFMHYQKQVQQELCE